MYDYIVIGAGSSGCVLAGRLTEDPHLRVLLLEAGRSDRRAQIRIPAAFPRLFKTDCDWAYSTEPEPHLQGRRLYWPRGKMLGGSSSMNAMMYVRGCAADYDEWAALGNAGWGFADVLPAFRGAERCQRGAARHRGGDGPLHVADLRVPNPATRAFVAAAQQAGIPRSHDINGPEQEGVDFTQVTQKRGARWSAADAYLKPARRRQNLRVVTGAHATRILLEGPRAIGVEYSVEGRVDTARAEREVIVSSGTVNSPQLLMLSGIGPASDLQAAGITPRHDLPGVGQNLQDHLAVAVVYGCTRPVSLAAAESVGNLLRFVLLRRGMLTSNIGEALAFVRSAPGVPAPDLELLFAPAPFIDHGLVRPAGHGLTIGVVLLRPVSRGRITLRSSEPLDPPRIEANYLSDQGGRDLAVLRAGVREALRIFSMPALAPWVTESIEPDAGVRSDTGLDTFIREQAETLYHPVGTCRMGVDVLAVVDPDLRVQGIDGLRVVDASIMPTIIRGHTNAAAIMIAEKAAELLRAGRAIRGDRPVRPERSASAV